MSDNKINIPDQAILLAEVIIKIAAIEKLLIKSGVITSDELTVEMKKISEEIMAIMSSKGVDFSKGVKSN